jgi:hypothetical protein
MADGKPPLHPLAVSFQASVAGMRFESGTAALAKRDGLDGKTLTVLGKNGNKTNTPHECLS